MTSGILWGVLAAPLAVRGKYSNGQPHHVTLQFGVDRADWEQWIGLEFEATATVEAWNGRVQAIALKLPDHIPCANQHPHVTVSWLTKASPVESNEMLGSRYSYRLFNQVVQFKIEFLEWEEVIE